ncbi:MAG: hypothetical protein V5B40_15410 [Candidatus Accumulibacter meliphilus]|jgi:hypothetical protein|uniref:hypothetical protein n=1 Tax=Candidatus Accumulibacter meliphilus TaxID=2211374 RepID=UPI002FC33825
MKRKIYVETSVISYLTAHPARPSSALPTSKLLWRGGKPATSTNGWCHVRGSVNFGGIGPFEIRA